MSPKFIFIAGPRRGTTLEVTQDELTIGRDPTNQLSVIDKALSRHHCLVRREGQRFKLCDLDSHNGTFVNEMPCKEHYLRHGDSIQLGSSYLLFLTDEEEGPPRSAVQIDDSAIITASAIYLKPEDALYSATRDLNVLIKVGAAITSAKSLNALQQELLRAVFEIVPAERGAVVLVEDDAGSPVSAFTLDRLTGAQSRVPVSRTVARQVMAGRVALLSNDVVADSTLSEAKSLAVSKVSALLCAPLIVRDRAIGFIYLDATDPAISFMKRHLQLVAALSNFVAGALENAQQREWLEGENRRLRAAMQEGHNLVGDSLRMREVRGFISRAAPTDSTVLIRGESGTGKEVVARAIHRQSRRSGRPFVAINCATLVEALLESELFGHEKGAFTGAVSQKKGKLELADGGTVFLDELAEMSPLIQAKLLRVLEEQEFERLGGTRPIKVDIRVIAATNKNLEAAIADGGFRRDLYYRLDVLSLTVPPLRDRPEDIPLLAQYFIAKYSGKCKRRVTGPSSEARRCLMSHNWPGNVRELENAIERAVVLGFTDTIQPEDLPEALLEQAPAGDDGARLKYYDQVKEAKRQILLKTFRQAGSHAEAAKLLGLHPNNLHRLVRNLDLRSSLAKEPTEGGGAARPRPGED